MGYAAGDHDRLDRPDHRAGVAYRLADATGHPEPLAPIVDLMVINTSDTTDERERDLYGDPLASIWGRWVAPYLGSPRVTRKVLRPVTDATDSQRTRWLDEVATLVRGDIRVHAVGWRPCLDVAGSSEPSWLQIAVSALAAITSAWIASRLGVAGTIIGAAIGSLAATISSALYGSTLDKGRMLVIHTQTGTVIQNRSTKGETQIAVDEAADVEPRSGRAVGREPPRLHWKTILLTAVAVLALAIAAICAVRADHRPYARGSTDNAASARSAPHHKPKPKPTKTKTTTPPTTPRPPRRPPHRPRPRAPPRRRPPPRRRRPPTPSPRDDPA